MVMIWYSRWALSSFFEIDLITPPCSARQKQARVRTSILALCLHCDRQYVPPPSLAHLLILDPCFSPDNYLTTLTICFRLGSNNCRHCIYIRCLLFFRKCKITSELSSCIFSPLLSAPMRCDPFSIHPQQPHFVGRRHRLCHGRSLSLSDCGHVWTKFDSIFLSS